MSHPSIDFFLRPMAFSSFLASHTSVPLASNDDRRKFAGQMTGAVGCFPSGAPKHPSVRTGFLTSFPLLPPLTASRMLILHAIVFCEMKTNTLKHTQTHTSSRNAMLVAGQWGQNPPICSRFPPSVMSDGSIVGVYTEIRV